MTPDFKWAQDAFYAFVTIELVDAKVEKMELKETSLDFRGTSDGKEYTLSVELYGPINPKESKYSVQSRGIELLLSKKGDYSDFWPHLLKNHKAWKTHCHIDWSKWVDSEDEAEEDPNAAWESRLADMEGFDPSDMSDFPETK